MKFINALIVGVIAQVASAHYLFDTAVVNGQVQNGGRYIRRTTRGTLYNPIKFSSNPPQNVYDGSTADGPDIRCNQGAFSRAGTTEVMTVTAGSEIRFLMAFGATMRHPGPAMVYMSRAPGDNVRAYDGSGDWFKIFQEGVCNNGDFTGPAWCTWDRNWIGARIPTGTPNGEYLIRVEHIGVHRSHVNEPEHYVSCMQVRVTGGGNGTPGPMVRFPGAYRASDPYANFVIYVGHRPFTFPGPPVWNGSGSNPNPPQTTARPPQTTSNPNPGGSVPLYGQCGGIGYNGPTSCAQGRCVSSNAYYSQCL